MADLAAWVDQLMSRPEDASKIAEAVLASSGESALSLALAECCRRPWMAAPFARCALIAVVQKHLLPECQHAAHLDALRAALVANFCSRHRGDTVCAGQGEDLDIG